MGEYRVGPDQLMMEASPDQLMFMQICQSAHVIRQTTAKIRVANAVVQLLLLGCIPAMLIPYPCVNAVRLLTALRHILVHLPSNAGS